jgi:hypothetical protein
VPPDTLHEVTEVAVIRHSTRGVLLLHSAERRWHFPDSTVRVGQPWDESLREAVRASTGIEDLAIGEVLSIQNFAAGEVDDRPQSGIFFSCTTEAPDVAGSSAHRWIEDVDELEEMDLFHPLVADLVERVLHDRQHAP